MANIRGKGTTLSIGGVSVGQLKELPTLFSGSHGTVDVTTLGSTVREFIATIGEYGDMSFGVIYDPAEASHEDFAGLIASGDTQACVITLSNSATIRFVAILTSFQVTGATVDSVVEAAITLKITGSPAWDADGDGTADY